LKLRFELQARNLTPAGIANLQQTLLAAVAPPPPVQPVQAAAAPLTDAELGARLRTSSGQSNSAVELLLQPRKLEVEEKRLEIAER